MLFYKTDSELENCKFSRHARYKRTLNRKIILVKAMHYLPLIPSLTGLYVSLRYIPHIRCIVNMEGLLVFCPIHLMVRHGSILIMHILILLVNKEMLDWDCVPSGIIDTR